MLKPCEKHVFFYNFSSKNRIFFIRIFPKIRFRLHWAMKKVVNYHYKTAYKNRRGGNRNIDLEPNPELKKKTIKKPSKSHRISRFLVKIEKNMQNLNFSSQLKLKFQKFVLGIIWIGFMSS